MKKIIINVFALLTFICLFINCGGGGGGNGGDSFWGGDDGNDGNGGSGGAGGDAGTGTALDDIGIMKSIVLDSGQGFSYAVTTTDKIIITGLTLEGEQWNSINIPSYIDGKEVVAIGKNAFKGASSGLTSISLPDSIIDIRQEAFSDCSGLVNINIPANVIRIGAYAFRECSNWTSELHLPDSLKLLGTCAFTFCSNLYGTISIPNGLKYIEAYTFNQCNGLTSVIFENTEPPVVMDNAFGPIPSIQVPYSLVDTYKGATGWTPYSTKISGY